jgi:hypothetical protein
MFQVHTFKVGIKKHGGAKAPDAGAIAAVLVIKDLYIKSIQLVKQHILIPFLSLTDINALFIQ